MSRTSAGRGRAWEEREEEEVEPPGRGGAAGGGARPPAPTHFGARVWAVTQKAPSWSQAPGGGVRPGARRAPGQVGRLPRGRAGSWGCRRCRRAPRARPAARCASLAEPVAGALGPPGDATAVAASVASTRDRCRGRLNKAQAQLCFLLVSLSPPKRVPFPLDVITQKGVKGIQ
ncbi:E3 ubiquitin-protein ligase RNF152 isoform X2 [Sus scrofa]|uniref:E3 ubiquitin-protein ligase RNF152 isoform X2 n=1 Tax=Sus scrofa TaxID=9823 RepID=UPI000A2B97C8|nr:E3 ubiquitin-protein ligase RNF152 isoform X2 [Sus scrofa]